VSQKSSEFPVKHKNAICYVNLWGPLRELSETMGEELRGNVDSIQKTIRMVAVDMDGTLLGTDGHVSAENLAAWKAAEAADIEVVVATGRRPGYTVPIWWSVRG